MPAWETTALGLGLLLCGSCSPSAVSSPLSSQTSQLGQPAQVSQPTATSAPTMERATASATFAAG